MSNAHLKMMLHAMSPLDEKMPRKKKKPVGMSVYARPDYKKRNKRLVRAMKRHAGDES